MESAGDSKSRQQSPNEGLALAEKAAVTLGDSAKSGVLKPNLKSAFLKVRQLPRPVRMVLRASGPQKEGRKSKKIKPLPLRKKAAKVFANRVRSKIQPFHVRVRKRSKRLQWVFGSDDIAVTQPTDAGGGVNEHPATDAAKLGAADWVDFDHVSAQTRKRKSKKRRLVRAKSKIVGRWAKAFAVFNPRIRLPDFHDTRHHPRELLECYECHREMVARLDVASRGLFRAWRKEERATGRDANGNVVRFCILGSDSEDEDSTPKPKAKQYFAAETEKVAQAEAAHSSAVGYTGAAGVSEGTVADAISVKRTYLASQDFVNEQILVPSALVDDALLLVETVGFPEAQAGAADLSELPDTGGAVAGSDLPVPQDVVSEETNAAVLSEETVGPESLTEIAVVFENVPANGSAVELLNVDSCVDGVPEGEPCAKSLQCTDGLTDKEIVNMPDSSAGEGATAVLNDTSGQIGPTSAASMDSAKNAVWRADSFNLEDEASTDDDGDPFAAALIRALSSHQNQVENLLLQSGLADNSLVISADAAAHAAAAVRMPTTSAEKQNVVRPLSVVSEANSSIEFPDRSVVVGIAMETLDESAARAAAEAVQLPDSSVSGQSSNVPRVCGCASTESENGPALEVLSETANVTKEFVGSGRSAIEPDKTTIVAKMPICCAKGGRLILEANLELEMDSDAEEDSPQAASFISPNTPSSAATVKQTSPSRKRRPTRSGPSIAVGESKAKRVRSSAASAVVERKNNSTGVSQDPVDAPDDMSAWRRAEAHIQNKPAEVRDIYTSFIREVNMQPREIGFAILSESLQVVKRAVNAEEFDLPEAGILEGLFAVPSSAIETVSVDAQGTSFDGDATLPGTSTAAAPRPNQRKAAARNSPAECAAGSPGSSSAAVDECIASVLECQAEAIKTKSNGGTGVSAASLANFNLTIDSVIGRPRPNGKEGDYSKALRTPEVDGEIIARGFAVDEAEFDDLVVENVAVGGKEASKAGSGIVAAMRNAKSPRKRSAKSDDFPTADQNGNDSAKSQDAISQNGAGKTSAVEAVLKRRRGEAEVGRGGGSSSGVQAPSPNAIRFIAGLEEEAPDDPGTAFFHALRLGLRAPADSVDAEGGATTAKKAKKGRDDVASANIKEVAQELESPKVSKWKAYNNFAIKTRGQIQEANPGWTGREVEKELGRIWRGLSEHERCKYQEIGVDDSGKDRDHSSNFPNDAEETLSEGMPPAK